MVNQEEDNPFVEEGKRILAMARNIADPGERSRLLARYSALRARYINILFEFVPRAIEHSAQSDAAMAKVKSRRRGDRSKLHGGRHLEDLAVEIVRLRVRLLKESGTLRFEDRHEQARKEIAPHFGIRPSVLEDWQRGVRRRYRQRRT